MLVFTEASLEAPRCRAAECTSGTQERQPELRISDAGLNLIAEAMLPTTWVHVHCAPVKYRLLAWCC
jgi:hypothetical protein